MPNVNFNNPVVGIRGWTRRVHNEGMNLKEAHSNPDMLNEAKAVFVTLQKYPPFNEFKIDKGMLSAAKPRPEMTEAIKPLLPTRPKQLKTSGPAPALTK